MAFKNKNMTRAPVRQAGFQRLITDGRFVCIQKTPLTKADAAAGQVCSWHRQRAPLAEFGPSGSFAANVFCICMAIAWLFSGGVSYALAQRDDLQRVLRDWEKRKNAFASVRYRVTGEVLIPKGTRSGEMGLPPDAVGDVPSKDYSFTEETSLTIAFERNWVRKELSSQVFFVPLAKFQPERGVYLCDGSQFKYYVPKKENYVDYEPSERQPDLYLDSSSTGYRGGFFTPHDYPILFGHGIPDCFSVDPRKLRVPPKNSEFSVSSHALYNNRPCVVLRRLRSLNPKIVEDLWIDIKRDSAVLRWMQFTNDHLEATLDIEYQAIGDSWLPLSWLGSAYSGSTPSRLMESYRLKVLECQPNAIPDKSELDIELKSDMVVEKDGSLYRVRWDGTLGPFSERHPVRMWIYLVVVPIVGGMIIVALRLLSRRRKITGE